jgi:hypothetical protein
MQETLAAIRPALTATARTCYKTALSSRRFIV